MKLLETTYFSAIATGIKMIAALIINKTVAIYVGPTGIALIGQMQNAIQVINIFAQGGINAGVTKYTAQYRDQPSMLSNIWSGSVRIALFCSIFVGLVLVILSEHLAKSILGNTQFTYIFAIFGCLVFLFSLNQLLIAILNGLKEIKTLTVISVIQSIYGLVFTVALVLFMGIDGALIGLTTIQSVVFFVALYKIKNHRVIRLTSFRGSLEIETLKKLFRYTLMAFTTAVFTPSAYLIVRNHIGSTMSWDHAGYWQATASISSMYLLVITTALATYFLPKMSETTAKSALRRELLGGYKILVPIVVVMSLLIFAFRNALINILFSPEFSQMAPLFKWQLIGDVLKIMGFLLSYLMLAKTMTLKYITSEIGFGVFYTIVAIYCVDGFGLVGVTYAYALNNLCYFFTMILFTRKIWW